MVLMIMSRLSEKTDHYMKYHGPLQNLPSSFLHSFKMLSRSKLAYVPKLLTGGVFFVLSTLNSEVLVNWASLPKQPEAFVLTLRP